MRLYQDLKAAGMDPWIDRKSLLAGSDVRAEIKSAIKNSDFFLALMSSRSVNKVGFVQREIREALDILQESPSDRIFVIPVRLDDCHPSHEGLKSRYYADLFPYWEEGVSKILRTILGKRKPRGARANVGTTVSALRILGDQSTLLVGTHLGVIYAYSFTPSLIRLAEFNAHEDRVTGIAELRQTSEIVTVGNDGYFKKWDIRNFPKKEPVLRSQKRFLSVEGQGLECRSVAVHEMQKLLAVAVGPIMPQKTINDEEDNRFELEEKYACVELLTTTDLSTVQTIPASEIERCIFGPDDSHLIILYNMERVAVASVEDGQIVHDLHCGLIYGFAMGGTSHMAIAKDKNLLAVNYIDQSGPTLLRLPRLQILRGFRVMRHEGQGRGWMDRVYAGPLAFNERGNRLAIGYSNGDIAGWELDRHEPIFVRKTGGASITELLFLPGLDSLLVGDQLGHLSIWPFGDAS